MTRGLLVLVVALVLLSSTFAAPVAIISAAARFEDLTAISGVGSYQYLYYVTNKTWTPIAFRWDCTKNPDVCTTDCGGPNADGPQCKNPTVPSNAPYGLDLETWPWQVRWGIPSGVGVNNGVGIPSGFGFRGTYDQGITNIYDTFWVGEAVHFNNVIIQSNNEANSWTLVLTLYVTVNGVTTSGTFRYRLRLDETLNRCTQDDGCPWTSAWWANNPTLDIRPDCPALTTTPRLPDGTRCCRYYSIKDFPCADRVWTLDAIDQSQSMIIDGRPYTLYIKGFSNPNNISQQRDYFIAQERAKTLAEIYANLVDACPSIQSCPAGQNLTVVGTQCICTCPSNLPSCGTGQVRNSTCGCECQPNAINCNGGTVKTSGTSCVCDCAGVTCPGNKIVDPNPANRCQCICPANICNGGSANPSDPTCPCTNCPTCSPGKINDARCNCVCPASAQAACESQGGQWAAADCSCNIPCFCLNSTCQTMTSCSGGVCSFAFSPGVACDPTNNLCLAKCGANGECIYDAVDCDAQVPTLADKYGSNNAQCWQRTCQSSSGACIENFLEGQACSMDLSGTGNNNECLKAECRTINSTTKACIAVPDNTKAGIPCTLPSNDQCNGASCFNGVCVSSPKFNQPCDDTNACTFLDNFINPVTGKPSDGCIPSPSSDPNIAVCFSNRTVCDQISVPCNNITCIVTPTGSFCLMTPLEYGTTCDDGTRCTVNDICQRELRADPLTGLIDWVDSGICEGSSAQCTTNNTCLVGRCLEGGGCNYRADVRQDFICGNSDDNCTIFRCDNGTCVEAESICPGGSSRTGAIVGATVAGVAAIAAAAAIAAYARNRIQNSKVFDPTTWDQLQAGAGTNSPLYEPKTNEQVNQLYHDES